MVVYSHHWKIKYRFFFPDFLVYAENALSLPLAFFEEFPTCV
jgi:hypothetical protein